MNRLTDKVAFVTGAAMGIGRAAVLTMAREGAHVIVTDIDAAGAESVARELKQLDVPALALWHDVTQEASWTAAIEATLSRFGRLDVLVNNAGVGPTKSLLETSLEDWRAVMRINLDGVFLGTRSAVQAMRPLPARPRTSSGSIINLSSILGLVGMSEAAAYSASKGAVRLLTKSVALECAAKGWNVRVNSIHPGFIATPMIEQSVARIAAQAGVDIQTQRKQFEALHPLGRMGAADDIAAAILYLASDESSFMTGSEVVVDGGYTAC